jgi:hypothetical protein
MVVVNQKNGTSVTDTTKVGFFRDPKGRLNGGRP